MENLAQMKVGKIVAHNFKTAKVLTASGIDFCCRGGITLEEACKQHDVQITGLLEELNYVYSGTDEYHYESMELRELINLIISVHHQYVRSTIPALRAYLQKLVDVHGERHAELHQIHILFTEGAGALAAHMEKEEQILFPFIEAMCFAQEQNLPFPRTHFGDIDNPIKVMEEEHETEGERFQKIASLTSNYICPPDGCQTYRVAYAMLKDFEEDLHKHIHLENNILFPEAKKLFNRFNL